MVIAPSMPEQISQRAPDQRSLWNAKHQHYSAMPWTNSATIFAEQALPYFPSRGDLIDIGAGQGQDSIFFAERGYCVTCTDFSDGALGVARERAGLKRLNTIQFRSVNLASPLPFMACSADIVYSHLALHYFSNERTKLLFEELHRTLRPGGIFAVLLNSIDDPEIPKLRRIEDGLFETPDNFHKRYFSCETLRPLVHDYEALLFDNAGRTYKDQSTTLVRFIGRKV